jgi:hypothetical protein
LRQPGERLRAGFRLLQQLVRHRLGHLQLTRGRSASLAIACFEREHVQR